MFQLLWAISQHPGRGSPPPPTTRCDISLIQGYGGLAVGPTLVIVSSSPESHWSLSSRVGQYQPLHFRVVMALVVPSHLPVSTPSAPRKMWVDDSVFLRVSCDRGYSWHSYLSGVSRLPPSPISHRRKPCPSPPETLRLHGQVRVGGLFL